MKEPGEKEKPEAEKNFLKKPWAEPAVLAGISLLYAAALLIIAGVRVGMYYFPESSAFYTRIQLDSLLEGCFKLSSSITELQFDTAWYNGGVQQIWGLGTALWTMPFEWISWFFGRTCPDALPLFVLLFLLGFYVLRTARRLFEFRGDLGFCSLFAGLILFNPTLIIFLWGVKGIYEITCLYGHLFSLLLLVGTIRYLLWGKRGDFYLVCLLAGFVANVRPTLGIYGVLSAGLCLGVLFYQRKRSDGQNWRVWGELFLGVILSLGGMIFLAVSNQIRFGNYFEFGHNLSFSAPMIIYLTRFGNPCEEVGLFVLGRELFIWLFTLPFFNGYFDLFPRWRDIYQPTFGFTGLALFLTALGLWIVFLRKRVGRGWGNLFTFGGNSRTTSKPILRRGIGIGGLFLWGFLSWGVLAIFYLRFSTISTRYIHDFAPAFVALGLAVLFCARGRRQNLLYGALFLYICWKVGYIALAPNTSETWGRSIRGLDNKYFYSERKNIHYPELYKLSQRSFSDGRALAEFDGSYSLKNHPKETKIHGNGLGWDPKEGTAIGIVLLAVDKPEYLELIMGKEPEGSEPVYRAKINNIELPLEEVSPTMNGENEAVRVRFGIPEEVLRQNGDQLVSLCFTPSYQQEDMERTRDLYRVSWRNPSLPSEPESPPTQQQIDPGSENNE